jgi:hypothetical protein
MPDPIGSALEAAAKVHPVPGFVAGAVREGKTSGRLWPQRPHGRAADAG